MNLLSQIAQVREAKATHLASLLAKQNVIASGIGYKIRGGEITDELGIIVSVTHKLPAAQLSAQDLVPSELEGIETDVVETGVIRAFQGHRDRWRPTAPPGVSIGHAQITAGTFGCLVRRASERLILSNNHVLANSNAGRPGDAVLQPGRADGGSEADKIAELVDHVTIDFGEKPQGCGASLAQIQRIFNPSKAADQALAGQNQVDAALARPFFDTLVSANILEIGVPAGIAEAPLGTEVQKSGRTTGYTTGRIIQIDVTVQVAYGSQTALFVDQLMADGMSQPGDSGSAVLDMDRNVVGLLFAGSDNTTLINPIQLVLDALDIQIITA